MAQFFTDFSGYSTGDITTEDWTEYGTGGGSWTVIAGDLLEYSSGGAEDEGLGWDSKSGSDVEVVIKIRFENNDAEGRFYAGLRGDTQSQAVYFAGDTGDNLVIKRNSTSGSETTLGSTSTTIDHLNFFWIRFRVNGTDLKAKSWQDGDSEPASWGVEVTDGNYSSGYSGFFGIGFTNYVADVIGVGTNGDFAPTSSGEAYNMIDDFESGSISSDWKGDDDGRFVIESTSPIEGNHSLRASDPDTFLGSSILINDSVTIGTDERSRFRHTFGNDAAPGPMFAAQNTNGYGSNSGYYVRYYEPDATHTINRLDNGSTTQIASASPNNTGERYHGVEVTSGGSVIHRLLDETGGEIDSLSATDSNYSSGYFGVFAFISSDSDAGTFDNVATQADLTAPETDTGSITTSTSTILQSSPTTTTTTAGLIGSATASPIAPTSDLVASVTPQVATLTIRQATLGGAIPAAPSNLTATLN